MHCHLPCGYTRGNVRAFVRKLRRTKGRIIWLLAGAKLVRDLVIADLIDDFIMSLPPILIGHGIAVFLPNARAVKLTLKHVSTFKSGLVQLCYSRT